MKSSLILLCGLLTASSALAYTLTEDNIIKMATKSNPTSSEIEASFLASKVQALEVGDRFGFEAYGQYGHVDTNERAVVSFQPVFTTINQYKVGVKKYSKYGLVLDANTTVTAQSGLSESGSNYDEIHTTKHEIGLQADLWKDFMGRISNSKFRNAKDLAAKDELQFAIGQKAFVLNVRRLYWNLVANGEKLKINKRLSAAAKKQLKDSKKRKANSVSDTAEVARFESLVHQRAGQIILLEYEREALLKSLRQMFPELNGQNLKLGEYNINKTIFEVLSCTQTIQNLKKVPYEHTKYDEVVALLKKVKEREESIAGTYDDIDLKLDLKLAQIGVSSETDDNTTYEGSYEGSLDDISDNGRQTFSAGLTLTIPFGEDRSTTAEVKEKLAELQFESQLQKIESNVNATHTQIKESVRFLTDLMRTQRANSKSLNVRVKELKKKYRQARIQEFVLIQDEELLLQSDISVIDTQLTVINTIFDYLSVFNTYPCQFNRI